MASELPGSPIVPPSGRESPECLSTGRISPDIASLEWSSPKESMALQRPNTASTGVPRSASTTPGPQSRPQTPWPSVPSGVIAQTRPASAGAARFAHVRKVPVDSSFAATPPPYQGSPCQAPTKPNSGVYRRPLSQVGSYSGCASAEAAKAYQPEAACPSRPKSTRSWQSIENRAMVRAEESWANYMDRWNTISERGQRIVDRWREKAAGVAESHPFGNAMEWSTCPPIGCVDLKCFALPPQDSLALMAVEAFRRAGSVWDARLWKEANNEAMGSQDQNCIAQLMLLVRRTTEDVFRQGEYKVAREGNPTPTVVDVRSFMAARPRVEWYGRPKCPTPSIPSHIDTSTIPLPLFFSHASPVDIAVSMRLKVGPLQPVVLVAEILELVEESGEIDLRSASALSPSDLLLRSDIARYLESMHHEIRNFHATRLKNHLQQSVDPYILQCPDVTIFRGSYEEGFPLYKQPVKIHVILHAMVIPKTASAMIVRKKRGPTFWYGQLSDHASLVERLHLIATVGHQASSVAGMKLDSPVLVLSLPGSQALRPQPRDAMANALKYWRRAWSKSFKSVFVCCRHYGDSETAKYLDEIVNKQVYKLLASEVLSSMGRIGYLKSEQLDARAALRQMSQNGSYQGFEEVIQLQNVVVERLSSLGPLSPAEQAKRLEPGMEMRKSQRDAVLVFSRSVASGDPLRCDKIELESCPSSYDEDDEPPVSKLPKASSEPQTSTPKRKGANDFDQPSMSRRSDEKDSLPLPPVNTPAPSVNASPDASPTCHVDQRRTWAEQKQMVRRRGIGEQSLQSKSISKTKKKKGVKSSKKSAQTRKKKDNADWDDEPELEDFGNCVKVPASLTSPTPLTLEPGSRRAAMNTSCDSRRAQSARASLQSYGSLHSLRELREIKRMRRKSCELEDRGKYRSYESTQAERETNAVDELKVFPVTTSAQKTKLKETQLAPEWTIHKEIERRQSQSISEMVGLHAAVQPSCPPSKASSPPASASKSVYGSDVHSDLYAQRQERRRGSGGTKNTYVVSDASLEVRRQLRQRMASSRTGSGQNSKAASRTNAMKSKCGAAENLPYSLEDLGSKVEDFADLRRARSDTSSSVSPTRYSYPDSPPRTRYQTSDSVFDKVTSAPSHGQLDRDSEVDGDQKAKPDAGIPPTMALINAGKVSTKSMNSKMKVADEFEVSLVSLAGMVEAKLEEASRSKRITGKGSAGSRQSRPERLQIKSP